MGRYSGSALGCLLLVFFNHSRGEYIDFRDVAFAAVGGQSSFAVAKGNVSMLLQAEPDGAVMVWSSTAGIGIVGYPEDYSPLEIGGREILTVAFPGKMAVHSATIRNLHNKGTYVQTGWYELDKSGKWIPFQAAEDQVPGTDGELQINISAEATVISFASPGWERRQLHDLTVAVLDVDPVPEPASFAVFSAVVAGLVWLKKMGRRRNGLSGPKFIHREAARNVCR